MAVRESFNRFVAYLASYSIELADIAPDMRVEGGDDTPRIVGVPVIEGLTTLDFSNRKITKRLPLPLGLECEAILCAGTLISGVDNLPEGLQRLVVSKNRRFKRWPDALPQSIEVLDLSSTALTAVGLCPERLQVLDCSLSEVATMAVLPPLLTELRCRANHLTALPELPNSLELLDVRSNPIATLPPLPASLRTLDWDTTLDAPVDVPTLPPGLTDLRWSHTGPAAGVLELPSSLQKLSIRLTERIELPSRLVSLSLQLADGMAVPALPSSIEDLWYSGTAPLPPSLPSALKTLRCGRNGLTELPPLPPSLTTLFCVKNELTSLPELPSGLEVLWCAENRLTDLPELPDSIVELNCEDNELTRLPELPVSLRDFRCNDNKLTVLPRLDRWWDDVDTAGGYEIDQGLRWISCQHNRLVSVPTLPRGLDTLRCQHNEITQMPPIPIGTTVLNCSHNRLTSLTDLPAKLAELYCNNNRELAVIDTYQSEPFDRLHKSNATNTALDEPTSKRLRSWRVRVD